MFIASIGIALLLAFLGWGIHRKKWYFLISGYNTMSKEEQQKVDIEGLAKAVARIMYILALLIFLLGLFSYLEMSSLIIVTLVAIIVVPFLSLLRKNKYMQNTMSPKAKKISILTSIVTLMVVAVMVFISMKDSAIIIENEALKIEGMYGDTIALTDIEQVELLDEMPAVKMRTNGSAAGSKLKGHFKLEGDEKAKLFVDQAIPPFIKLQANDTIYYLNQPSSEETTKLFEQLQ